MNDLDKKDMIERRQHAEGEKVCEDCQTLTAMLNDLRRRYNNAILVMAQPMKDVLEAVEDLRTKVSDAERGRELAIFALQQSEARRIAAMESNGRLLARCNILEERLEGMAKDMLE